ncbi:MAG: hypothetical protein JWP00_2448 [Chloroflexi bacterium]|nr:hypothetical protein [Chloroflexota bacterium]
MTEQPGEAQDLEVLDERLRRIAAETLQREGLQWFSGEPRLPRDPDRWICFLGTGGSPRCMLTQVAHTGGFMINLPNFALHVDPGPGAILQANRHKLDPTSLDAVFVSHAHTDHYTEANTIIEGMCRMMSQRRGCVLAPGEILDGNYISPFHQGHGTTTGPYRGGPATTLALRDNQPVALGEVTLTPHQAYHGGENYGFVLDYHGLTIGYTSDTNYVKSYRNTSGQIQEASSANRFGELADLAEIVDYRHDLKEIYSQVDILVANVTFHNMWSHRHLTGYGLTHLLTGSRVKQCFITHLDSTYFTNPGLAADLAAYITRKSGVKSQVPVEGTRYEL